MKKYTAFTINLLASTALVAMMTACASQEKPAEGPKDAKQAKTAQGTVEVQPTADEMARQQKDEADRQKQAEIDKMREEEGGTAPSPVASTVTTAPGVYAPEGLSKVYFDFDKYEIKPEFRESLERNAADVKANSTVKVVVEGHCDERGTEEYNLALGERRATSVKKYFVSLGVKEDQLFTISYGEERPAMEGHTEAEWSKNRRVQFSQE